MSLLRRPGDSRGADRLYRRTGPLGHRTSGTPPVPPHDHRGTAGALSLRRKGRPPAAGEGDSKPPDEEQPADPPVLPAEQRLHQVPLRATNPPSGDLAVPGCPTVTSFAGRLGHRQHPVCFNPLQRLRSPERPRHTDLRRGGAAHAKAEG